MYVKIFNKLLDSSIWLEPATTRIVWMTFLVSMDETGFAQFASVGNVARRANVSLDEARTAIQTLEGPDPDSSDPDNDGRRLERLPGGWQVLNAVKHRAIATRAAEQEANRLRAARHRERVRRKVTPPESSSVTRNAAVTPIVTSTEKSNGRVPPIEAEKEAVRTTNDATSSDDNGQEAQTLRAFGRAWSQHYRGTYVPAKSDLRKAAVLTASQLERLPESLVAYFAPTADAFYRNHRHPFAVFVAQFDRILAGSCSTDNEDRGGRHIPSAEATAAYLRDLKAATTAAADGRAIGFGKRPAPS